MKTWYTTDFTGHYPVGTAAVLLARDEPTAREMLAVLLTREGLDAAQAETCQVVELVLPEVACCTGIILCNGDY